jgi:hypothetical protein
VVAAKAEVKKDLNVQSDSIQERLRKRKAELASRSAAKKSALTTKNTTLKTFNFEPSPERQGN